MRVGDEVIKPTRLSRMNERTDMLDDQLLGLRVNVLPCPALRLLTLANRLLSLLTNQPLAGQSPSRIGNSLGRSKRTLSNTGNGGHLGCIRLTNTNSGLQLLTLALLLLTNTSSSSLSSSLQGLDVLIALNLKIAPRSVVMLRMTENNRLNGEKRMMLAVTRANLLRVRLTQVRLLVKNEPCATRPALPIRVLSIGSMVRMAAVARKLLIIVNPVELLGNQEPTRKNKSTASKLRASRMSAICSHGATSTTASRTRDRRSIRELGNLGCHFEDVGDVGVVESLKA
jgi:hypothetical protein